MSVRDTVLWLPRQLAAVPGRAWSQVSGIEYWPYVRFYFVKPIINLFLVTTLFWWWAAGRGTAWQQVLGSILAAIQMIVASFTVLTWLAAIFIPTLLIGLLRFIPWVDQQWVRLTGMGGSEYTGHLDREVTILD